MVKTFNLEHKGKAFDIVIRERESDYERANAQLVDLLKSIREYLPHGVGIIHDLDIGADGVAEPPHIHFVGWGDKYVRGKTLLNFVAKAVGVDNLAVSLDKVGCLSSCLRYLVHFDDIDKEQYAPTDVVYMSDGGVSKKAFENAILNPPEYDADNLLDLYFSCEGSVPELLSVMGVHNYNRYRNIFNDLARWEKGGNCPKPKKA